MPAAIRPYIEAGASLFCTHPDLKLKLSKIRLFLFDWDGVFNNGSKIGSQGSSFSEIDSLGTNLLRFGFYKQNGEMPLMGILSGASNELGNDFAQREHFNLAMLNFKNKSEALDLIIKEYSLEPEQIAFFFDDVLDLSVAARVGFRIFLGSKHSPSFNNYVQSHGLVDLIPSVNGGENGVREACDFMLEAIGQYSNVISDRLSFSSHYSDYWNERQSIITTSSKGS